MDMLNELHVLDAWFVTRIRLDEWIVTHLRGTAPFERGKALKIPAAMRDAILHGHDAKSKAERLSSSRSRFGPPPIARPANLRSSALRWWSGISSSACSAAWI